MSAFFSTSSGLFVLPSRSAFTSPSDSTIGSIMVRTRSRLAAKRSCAACLVEKPGSAFPDAPPTTACEHQSLTCSDCLQIFIFTKLENCYQPKGCVNCPDCDEEILYTDMDKIATTEDVERFWKKYDRITRSLNPSWRWCLDPTCHSGQKHIPHEPRSLEAPDIFECNLCGAHSCTTCDRPWHEGVTCEEYGRANMKSLVTEAIDRKTIEALEANGVFKKCPQCSCLIEKFGDSDDIQCSRCMYLFYWSSS